MDRDTGCVTGIHAAIYSLRGSVALAAIDGGRFIAYGLHVHVFTFPCLTYHESPDAPKPPSKTGDPTSAQDHGASPPEKPALVRHHSSSSQSQHCTPTPSSQTPLSAGAAPSLRPISTAQTRPPSLCTAPLFHSPIFGLFSAKTLAACIKGLCVL
jgi:hypothetical protein